MQLYSSNNEINENNNPYLFKLAKITFALYLFFIFFGTSLPFREKTRNLESISTSNTLNQIIFGTLFILSIILLIDKRKEVIQLIKREKYFFIFLVWCLLSILWSEYPFVSFKRYIQYLTTITVPLAILLYFKNSDELLKYFFYILSAYIIISLATIFTIPMARNEQGYWRGIHTDKNGFGQITIMLIIFFSIHFGKSTSLKIKVLDMFFILTSIVLTVGSRSSTALITLSFLIALWISFNLDKLFNPIGIRKTISLILIFFSLLFLFITIFLYPELFQPIMDAMGKDLTFSGRIDIWNDIWLKAKDHLLMGAGFRGFWVIDSPTIIELYQKYIWLPNEAHNGYLDILNEIGIVGIILFFMIIINYFVNLIKEKSNRDWSWFVVASIILNITESKFITPKAVTGVMFIYAYLVLFTGIMKKKQIENE